MEDAWSISQQCLCQLCSCLCNVMRCWFTCHSFTKFTSSAFIAVHSGHSVCLRWLHPELAEELSFLRKLKRANMKAGPMLNHKVTKSLGATLELRIAGPTLSTLIIFHFRNASEYLHGLCDELVHVGTVISRSHPPRSALS